jgi:ureidoacrylate peracid hydrolase
MGHVELDARPAPIEIDLGRTAIVVIDMQNDFGTKGGMFDRAGIDISPIQAIVAPVATVLAMARASGLPVVYTKQQHDEDLFDAGGETTPHRIKHRRMQIGAKVLAPDGCESRTLVRDTWSTDIVPELTPQPGDIVVPKFRFSGFFGTPLDSILRAKGVSTLVFVGATTSICVESTLRDAMFRDYTCIILSDCTAEPIAHDAPRSNHEASLLNIELLFGWVSDSVRLVSAIGLHRQAAE